MGGNLTAAGSGGAQTTFSVDGNDRLTGSSVGGGTDYANDTLGRRTSQATGGVTATYGYDDASRLTSWSRGADSATYTRDAHGHAPALSSRKAASLKRPGFDGGTFLGIPCILEERNLNPTGKSWDYPPAYRERVIRIARESERPIRDVTGGLGMRPETLRASG